MLKMLEGCAINASDVSKCLDRIYTASNKFGVPFVVSTWKAASSSVLRVREFVGGMLRTGKLIRIYIYQLGLEVVFAKPS